MNSPAFKTLLVAFLLITGTYFLFNGLVSAKGFLIPLTISILLSMIMVPVSRKMEKRNISRGWASFLCTLILVLAYLGIFAIISAEIASLASDWPKMKEQIQPKVEKVRDFVSKHQLSMTGGQSESSASQGQDNSSAGKETGTANNSSKQQNSQRSSSSPASGILGFAGSMVMNFFTFLGNSLLTFVYIFFFMAYRDKFKKAALKFFKDEEEGKAENVIKNSMQVSQDYLIGRLILILFLAIMYAIGLSISNIRHAILISVIAALLTLIPYIGNIIGVSLALAMALLSGNGVGSIVGVIITFSIVQFVESYFLEPFFLGSRVELNPVITIIVVVLGGAVWGAAGMIIAIPIIAIFKIIADHISFLHPVGYTLGVKDISENESNNYLEQLKKKFQKNKGD